MLHCGAGAKVAAEQPTAAGSVTWPEVVYFWAELMILMVY